MQFRVRVQDNRSPQRQDVASVVVRVGRNDYLPEFQGQPYTTDVSENLQIDGSVFTVLARDRDPGVRTMPKIASGLLCNVCQAE